MARSSRAAAELGIICKLTFANDNDKDKDNDKAKAEKLTGNICRKVAKGKGKEKVGKGENLCDKDGASGRHIDAIYAKLNQLR